MQVVLTRKSTPAAGILCVTHYRRAVQVIAFNHPRAIAIQFRYGFLVNDDGLKVIDLTEPERARLVEGASVPLRDARDVYVARTYAYVADGKDGVAIVDVKNLEKPRLDRHFNAEGKLNAATPRKAETALGLFERYVDTSDLLRRVSAPSSDRLTPMMFEHKLLETARSDKRRVVLPEGTEPRVLHAAEVLLRRGVCDLTLLGPLDQIRKKAADLGIDLGDCQLIDPATSELRDAFAEKYAALRAHKGVTVELAYDVVSDVNYFGTLMVQEGLADGMVSGSVHSTAATIRPAFEIIKTKPDADIVSSVFFMCLADKVLVYGDCAINPDPNPRALADIAISSAQTAQQFGVEPRIAMLSYSTGTSGSGADVDKVREATELVRQRRPDLKIEGPIQYDAAVEPTVAETKLPGSEVAGQASVLIFPDLNTGNNTYKAVQRSAGAIAVGPVLQGLRKPVNDLSRGALVSDIVNTVAITAIQAQIPTPATETATAQ